MRDFHYTVNVLVKAYLNDTLEHSNCFACAVGNMIADSMNLKYCKQPRHWHELQWESGMNAAWYDFLIDGSNKEEAMIQIRSTGYSLSEIKEIEWAFEHAYRGDSKDEYMFNGLTAVVDVLADIHGIDLTTREEAKKAFVKTSS